MSAWNRDLSDEERRIVAAAREKAWTLYEGVRTPHRSCGIALAETFSLPTRPYQSLRKGGLTGTGICGAAMGGRLVLGEVLGDANPTGATTARLLAAMTFFDAELGRRTDRMRAETWVCNDLTGQFAEFASPERASFCARLATEVATLTAECLLRAGETVEVTPIAGLDLDPAAPRPVGPPMPVLDEAAHMYRQIRFTENTVPAGLLRAHNTKEGVWARIVVEEGRLRYRINDGVGGQFLLEPGGLVGIAPPGVVHEVAPDGPVVFVVQFCRVESSED